MNHNENEDIILVEPDNPDHLCINREHYTPLSEENWLEANQRYYYEMGTNVKGFCQEGGDSEIYKPDDSGQDCNAFKDYRR